MIKLTGTSGTGGSPLEALAVWKAGQIGDGIHTPRLTLTPETLTRRTVTTIRVARTGHITVGIYVL